MAAIDVSTKAPSTGRELAVSYDFGDDCDGAVAKFGKEAVFANFRRNGKIDLQGVVRRYLSLIGDKLISDEDILTKVETWKVGVPTERAAGGTMKTLEDRFGKMSDEAKLALIEKLKAKLKVA